MKTRFSKATTITSLAALLGLATAGVSSAQTVYLAARAFNEALPGGASVPMWGFAKCTSNTFAMCEIGPGTPATQINATAGGTLTIQLKNELSVPVSLVIPGQRGAGNPVIVGGRVRSFTQEAAPLGGTRTYTFTNIRPGTYLYQSGTHPSIQVPMGLYGALVVQNGGYPGVATQVEALVLYSEIDPVQNAAVAAAGSPAAYPAAVDYTPQYFLVNGTPYDAATPPSPIGVGDGSVSRTLLLRLANAGLRSHAAAIVGLDATVRAEDGNVLPTPLPHSSVLLPAGKTLDATVALPAGSGTYPVYDRMLDLTNAGEPGGGLLAYLQAGSGSLTGPPPSLGDDMYAVTEDMTLNVTAPGVLGNDGGATNATKVTDPAHGTLTLNADGSFSYTPAPDFSGEDSFIYSASTGTATVLLSVSFENDAPVAAPDTYTNNVGTTISVAAPGVLGNDTDLDGDELIAQLVFGSVALNADGSFTYTGGSTSFQYQVFDGSATSTPPVTVELNIQLPNGPMLTVLDAETDAPITEYRWVLEEDTTFRPDPAAAPNPPELTLSLNFHRSYMPVVAQGCMGSEAAGCPTPVPLTDAVIDPAKHYFVSVKPLDGGMEDGHTLGAAAVPAGATSVTVRLNPGPVPTAQISVFVFEDNYPTNGAPDGNEAGLGGFQIIVEDAGGRYGHSGGQMMNDVYGMPLKNWRDCGPGAPTPPENVILSCPNGAVLIKDLPPGKYGIVVVPPAGSPIPWKQTSTIEGSKVVDAWVKAGETPYFWEFGALGFHVFTGFVRTDLTPPGGNTVSGRVTNLHMSRPPNVSIDDSDSRVALGHTTAWVGVNAGAGGGPIIAAVQADDEGFFEIDGIPDGVHQLVIWDDYLDQIIAYHTVYVSGSSVDVGNVGVFNWFARLEHWVFLDANGNAIRDSGEPGIPEQAVNLRWRDGTIYQSFPTDLEGFVPFDEIFPFFSWQVAEVDFGRQKATGVTVTVDAGGDVTGGPYPGLLNPQEQPENANMGYRTETGPVLTQAFQGFLGQTSILEWGKKPYEPGENGGISGIVYYSTTRAEDDPRLGAPEFWEPGIPRVTVRLYREVKRADGTKGLVFVEEVQTDSWDDSLPTGCPGYDPTDPIITEGLVSPPDKCYDGLRVFNQVRPGVFDGGYAFSEIPAGRYVVEVIPPPGYEVVREEDKNVDFGDYFATAPVTMALPGMAIVEVMPDLAMVAAAQAPEPGLAQPACVGPDHTVPDYLSLFPLQEVPAPFAGATDRPLCNRKAVVLNNQANGVADFYLFTQTPVSARVVGLIADDVAQEFSVATPQIAEKWAPPFAPISYRDWTGREIHRVYSDQWGRFNNLLPSTITNSMPMASGVSPGMHIACMNDPGPIPGPGGTSIIDPYFHTNYGTVCYTLQYMPGATTYLDTPVLPTAAFAAGNNPVDCALPNGTPVIRDVTGSFSLPGPWIDPSAGQGDRRLRIRSMGNTVVPNPAYDGPGGTQPISISRDYGFGQQQGTGSVTVGGIPVSVVSWNNNQIIVQIEPDTTTGQLLVTRGDGKSTTTGVTVHVEATAPLRVTAGSSIQAAIDAATPGRLIIVEPGTYEELLIVGKPVRLQGSGAGETLINAVKRPEAKLLAWRAKLESMVDSGAVDLLPNQETMVQLGREGGVDPMILGSEQGAGITVLGRESDGCAEGMPPAGCFGTLASEAVSPRIDGFTITGGDSGGGIFVNGWAHHLQVSNNRLFANSGLLHGGMRFGMPFLPGLGAGSAPFGFNNNVHVHHNTITHNGGQLGAGGGISLCTGTDNYLVDWNWICGNFTLGHGAGLAHFGLSDNGQIRNNKILFNQNFNQGLNRHGGGLLIAGEPPTAPATLTLGAGNVDVDANLIQGNQAGAGHGAGVRLQQVNGLDVPAGGPDPYVVRLTNNMIANNVAGWSGGGISLMDTAFAEIVNNTVAHNDSTATVGAVFTDPDTSVRQPAGIVAESHGPALAALLGPGFSNPLLTNNIVWENRSFHYDTVGGVGKLDPDLNPMTPGECATVTGLYWDLGVLGGGASLDPMYSVLTSTVGYDALNSYNVSTPPMFVASYCNTARSPGLTPETSMQVSPAPDEGGNWTDVRFGPIGLANAAGVFYGDYHIEVATTEGDPDAAPSSDYDGDGRAHPVERGADELPGGGPPPPPQGTVAFTSATLGTLSDGTLDFGNLPTGTYFSTVTLTVSGAPVTFGTVTVTGARFDESAETCESQTVSAGNTCTVTIRFRPQNNNILRTGALTVLHDGIGSPQTLALSGR